MKMSHSDGKIDLYDDAGFKGEGTENGEENGPGMGGGSGGTGEDLFDAVLQSSSASGGGRNSRRSTEDMKSAAGRHGGQGGGSLGVMGGGRSSTPSQPQQPVRKHACYVGNMTWWTTDQDLIDVCSSVGIGDVMEVKFYENRANGQSKGFAICNFSGESSLKVAMDKLPTRELHGQRLVVMPYTKTSLMQFENASRKNEPAQKAKAAVGTPQPGQTVMTPDARTAKYIGTVRVGPVLGALAPSQQPGPPGAPSPSGAPLVSAPGSAMQQQPVHSVPQSLPAGLPGMPVRPGMPPLTGPPPGLPPGIRHQGTPLGFPPGMPAPPGRLLLPPPSSPGGVPASQARPMGPPPGGAPLAAVPPPRFPPSNMPPPVFPVRPLTAPVIPPPGALNMPAAHVNPTFLSASSASNIPTSGLPISLAGPHAAGSLSMSTASIPIAVSSIPTAVPASVHTAVGGSSGYAAPPVIGTSASAPAPTLAEPLSEAEFEEIMNRNKTVSSSAISRAVSDASAGDYASAIETLVTAISLIRQSKVAHDDRCKILIASLQDTLHGIEAKSYGRGKERSRDRSRSRDRESRRERKRRERSPRSRSRSRDRGPSYRAPEYSPPRHAHRY